MHLHKSLLTLGIVLCFLIQSCVSQSNGTIKDNWVFDYEEVFTQSQIQELNSIIISYEQKTTNEIAIVTVDSIGRFNKMVDFAVDFGKQNGIGKNDRHNGLVIVFSKKMRQTFLATGYGTEKILKDEICKSIIDSDMIPYFKKEDYFGGIKAGLLSCMEKWN